MPKNVVIVESPAKAKTIEKYLGQGYKVTASMGHIRDLPPKKLGVDVEHDFEPTYQVLDGKKKVVGTLKKAVKGADDVYMATDLDREGEAIAWHLCQALGLEPDRVRRVVFNEITKGAIKAAFEQPGEIDMNKVSAQEARRILDRLVGYKLSPLLWKKVAKGLSAGRVQSVAVRLLVEKEKEIREFEPAESWRITATLAEKGADETDEGLAFEARLTHVDEEPFKVATGAEAKRLGEAMRGAEWAVRSIGKRRTKDWPLPPFITSQLQRTASTVLNFSTKKTMTLAQRLYQGVDLGPEGSVALITYMRTDSHRVAPSAQQAAREVIGQRYGEKYLPQKSPAYKSSGQAQEAHEAIRPTEVTRHPDDVKKHLGRDEGRLYDLIWRRFVASQMVPGQWDVTDIEVEATSAEAVGLFKTRGRVLVFDGHMKVAGVRHKKDEQQLPDLAEGDALDLRGLVESQHFSQPPSRYSEATLVKRLEELGIGRPSTYSTIVTTVEQRGYAEQKKNLFLRCTNYPQCQYTVPCNVRGKPIGPEVEEVSQGEKAGSTTPTPTVYKCAACGAKMEPREGKRVFFATELGEVVTEKLVKHFADILDYDFTSDLESDLDSIEEAKDDWLKVVRKFWEPFSQDLEKAEDEMESAKGQVVEEAGPCPECGKGLVQRWSKRGPFYGCSGYPECKYTRPLEGEKRPEPKPTEHKCDKCGGTMLLRVNRRGEAFLGCENFPDCRSTLPCDDEGNPIRPEPTGETCEKCGSEMVVKRGRRGPFMACSGYPKCRNTKPLPKDRKKGGGKGKGGKGKGGGRKRSKAIPTGRECPDCGKELMIRSGRRGKFLGCAGYPKCRHTEDVPEDLKEKAEE